MLSHLLHRRRVRGMGTRENHRTGANYSNDQTELVSRQVIGNKRGRAGRNLDAVRMRSAYRETFRQVAKSALPLWLTTTYKYFNAKVIYKDDEKYPEALNYWVRLLPQH